MAGRRTAALAAIIVLDQFARKAVGHDLVDREPAVHQPEEDAVDLGGGGTHHLEGDRQPGLDQRLERRLGEAVQVDLPVAADLDREPLEE